MVILYYNLLLASLFTIALSQKLHFNFVFSPWLYSIHPKAQKPLCKAIIYIRSRPKSKQKRSLDILKQSSGMTLATGMWLPELWLCKGVENKETESQTPLKFKILPFKIFLSTRMNGTKYAEIGSSPTKGTAANVEIKQVCCLQLAIWRTNGEWNKQQASQQTVRNCLSAFTSRHYSSFVLGVLLKKAQVRGRHRHCKLPL